MKKAVRLTALAIALLLALTSCSNGEGQNSQTDGTETVSAFEQDPEKVEGNVVWWYWDEPGARLMWDVGSMNFLYAIPTRKL